MTTADIPPLHPDLMIAIPSIRRLANERWIVHLWRGKPCQANFRYYRYGVIKVNHLAEWDDCWSEPLPVEIPPGLKSRAHRELRRLVRHVEQELSVPEHLAQVRAKRRKRLQIQRPKLLRS